MSVQFQEPSDLDQADTVCYEQLMYQRTCLLVHVGTLIGDAYILMSFHTEECPGNNAVQTRTDEVQLKRNAVQCRTDEGQMQCSAVQNR